jgi:hypothetical protein
MEKVRQVRDAEARGIDELDEFANPSPWLRRAGFHRHLKKFSGRKAFLRSLAQPEPLEASDGSDEIDTSNEAGLGLIWAAMDRLVQEGKKLAVIERIGLSALFEVQRLHGDRLSTKPYHFRPRPSTVRKYCRVWKQLVAYCVRSWDMAPDGRPPYKKTAQQEQAYLAMMYAADDLDEPEADAQARDGGAAQLEGCVLRFCVSILDQPLGGTDFDSVLVSGLCVLAVRQDGGWEEPGNFTPKLSAVIKLGRLWVVSQAHAERQASVQAMMQRGRSREAAEEASPSCWELTVSMVRRFMLISGEGVQPTPMRWMVQLRNYGMKVHFSAAVEGQVSWAEDRIIFQKDRVYRSEAAGDAPGDVEQMPALSLPGSAVDGGGRRRTAD